MFRVDFQKTFMTSMNFQTLGARRMLVTNWSIPTAPWLFAALLFQPSRTPLETHLSLTLATREIEQLGNQQGQVESYLQMLAEKMETCRAG